jgi:phosphatidylglycerophosphate synthase
VLVAKQVADLITFSRVILAITLCWLGFIQGPAGLLLAAGIMLLNWTGDSLDGSIARRSRVRYQTWIGNHDLQVDMLVSIGLLIFLVASGFWEVWLAWAYILVWSVVFWHWGLQPALGMLFQAPIYARFIWVALHQSPWAGWMMVGWILLAVVLTWPKFPKMVVPSFLAGIHEVGRRTRM